MSESLRVLSSIEYGASPKEIRVQDYTPIEIYGTGGKVGYAAASLFNGPLVIVARKGTLDKPIYVEGACWVIDTAFAVLPKNDVNAKWLYYQLSNCDLKKLNESTGVPSISRDYLYRLSFEKQSLPEQRKIARILSTVDAIIEKTEAAIAKYKAIRQGMMHDLFTRGLDENGHLRPRYEDAPDLYKYTELGWVPKEWETEQIGNVLKIKHGFAFSSKFFTEEDTGFILLTPGNFHLNGHLYFEKRNTKYFSGSIPEDTIFSDGDLLIVMTDLTQDMNILGNVVILNSQKKVLHNQRIGKIMLNKKDYTIPKYVLYVLNTYYSKSNIKRTATGTTVRHTSPENIYKSIIPIPKSNEQELIANSLISIDKHISREFDSLQKMASMKRGFMSDLLTGKKTVKCDDEEKVA